MEGIICHLARFNMCRQQRFPLDYSVPSDGDNQAKFLLHHLCSYIEFRLLIRINWFELTNDLPLNGINFSTVTCRDRSTYNIYVLKKSGGKGKDWVTVA